MKLQELEKYVIELDDLHMPQSGRHLFFTDLKQFLLEAELAEQPVFRRDTVLYFFIDNDVAMYQKFNETKDGEYLKKWDRKMVLEKRRALKKKDEKDKK